MISGRQEKLLDFLIKEYISTAEPVSSKALKQVTDLDVCGATIRNDLQILTKQGYIEQPHISAGRVPTQKAYKYFAEKISSEIEKPFDTAQDKAFSDFIFEEMRRTRRQIEDELRLAEELMKSLSEVSMTLTYTKMQKKDGILEILEILGPSKNLYQKNMDIINEIIKELENF